MSDITITYFEEGSPMDPSNTSSYAFVPSSYCSIPLSNQVETEDLWTQSYNQPPPHGDA